MLRIFVLLISTILLSGSSQINHIQYPETIRIGLYASDSINKIQLSVLSGKYSLQNIESRYGKIKKEPYSNFIIKSSEQGISFISERDTLFFKDSLLLKGESFNNTFLINPIENNFPFRIYDNDLTIINDNNNLLLINTVPFENYIAGVVQAESGYRKHPEYYKIQAIISRTYAIRNIDRHKDKGYNLCDKVHCQVYYRKSTYPSIINATEYTRGEIVVDERDMPINTVYHANCGGMTIGSENVWISATPYLKSVEDPFCLDMRGAKWERIISKAVLDNYLQRHLRHRFNSEIAKEIYNFSQETRKIYLDRYNIIHLTAFRSDFNLRSTFFDMELSGDSIIIKGRGFGHGVGLCQEGAMRMAEKGFSRDSIIKFYYNNSNISNIK